MDGNEDHVPVTNLIDQKEYRYAELRGPYRKRWPVEESFKLLKTRTEPENLSGKTAHTVRQDFHGIIFRADLSSVPSRKLTKKGLKHINPECSLELRHEDLNGNKSGRFLGFSIAPLR